LTPLFKGFRFGVNTPRNGPHGAAFRCVHLLKCSRI